MKISDLVEVLTDLKEEYGDMHIWSVHDLDFPCPKGFEIELAPTVKKTNYGYTAGKATTTKRIMVGLEFEGGSIFKIEACWRWNDLSHLLRFRDHEPFPTGNEVLTGYLETFHDEKKVDELYVECRPEKYIEDSFKIHGISRERAMRFPPKHEGMMKVLNYIRRHPRIMVCHARWEMFGKKGYFDWQVLRDYAYQINKQDRFYELFRDYDIQSTHTIAKKSIHLPNYSLENMAKHYNIPHRPHCCISDVQVCRQIYFKLLNTKSSLLDFMEDPDGQNS